VESHITVQETVRGMNRLAIRLLANLHPDPEPNLLVSPSSLAFSLAVALNGAEGATYRDLAAALGMEQFVEDDVNRRLHDLRVQVQQVGPIAVDLATAVWTPPSIVIDAGYLHRVRQAYAAEVRALGGVGLADAETVNGWARERTSGRVTRLVGADDLTAGKACVLTDVVCFGGPWAAPFDLQETRFEPFTLPGGHTKDVPMMTRSGRHHYLATDEFQAVALDYAGYRFCLVVLLPSMGTATDHSVWDYLRTRMEPTELDLSLPRFSVTCELNLVPSLAGLGLGGVFAPTADFSRMGLRGSYIAAWRQTARIDVEEKGTEAAAGTAVIMERRLRTSMVVNRPFSVAIIDKRSGLFLFLGQITAP
jgi:serine protease inhibitor